MSNKIIAISGNSGSGKTTIAQALAKSLHATAIFWDDFDDISTSPDDYVAWYHQGEGYEAWDYPLLAMTIETLKNGLTLLHPALNHRLNPTQCIIFDAPLGRFHYQTGQFIDLWIHIDTPLDVALARRTIRDFTRDPRTVSHVIEELQYYLDHSRPLFFDEKMKESADLIINGTLPITEQVKIIEAYLKQGNDRR
jgi:uridine kinase